MKLRTLGAFALFATFLAAPAWAQQWPTTDPGFSKPDSIMSNAPEGFGSPGQMLITSEFDIDLGFVSESADSGSVSGPNITISPSVMFFLAPRFAVGGIVRFHHVGQGDLSTTDFVFGPTAAYNFPISERASIFPIVGLTYTWNKTSLDTSGGRMTNSGYDFGLLLKAPLLFHPFPHVFVGFGPVIVIDFTAERDNGPATKTRSFGLTLDLGFWL